MPWPSATGDAPFYRRVVTSELLTWRVVEGESDLSISSERAEPDRVAAFVSALRGQIEDFAIRCPSFLVSLRPLAANDVPRDRPVPSIVRRMLGAAEIAGIGPMAAVAGAIAEAVAARLGRDQGEVIVENGGDVFIRSAEPRVCAIYAGQSPFSLRVGVRLQPRQLPCAVCTSSGTVGPSLSMGSAEAAVVMAPSGSLADALATALANRIHDREDLKPAVEWAAAAPGVVGALGILGEDMAVQGDVELVHLTGEPGAGDRKG